MWTFTKKEMDVAPIFHRAGQTGSDSLETKMVPTKPTESTERKNLLGPANNKELRLKLATWWSQLSPTTGQWPQIQLQTV